MEPVWTAHQDRVEVVQLRDLLRMAIPMQTVHVRPATGRWRVFFDVNEKQHDVSIVGFGKQQVAILLAPLAFRADQDDLLCHGDSPLRTSQVQIAHAPRACLDEYSYGYKELRYGACLHRAGGLRRDSGGVAGGIAAPTALLTEARACTDAGPVHAKRERHRGLTGMATAYAGLLLSTRGTVMTDMRPSYRRPTMVRAPRTPSVVMGPPSSQGQWEFWRRLCRGQQCVGDLPGARPRSKRYPSRLDTEGHASLVVAMQGQARSIFTSDSPRSGAALPCASPGERCQGRSLH